MRAYTQELQGKVRKMLKLPEHAKLVTVHDDPDCQQYDYVIGSDDAYGDMDEQHAVGVKRGTVSLLYFHDHGVDVKACEVFHL